MQHHINNHPLFRNYRNLTKYIPTRRRGNLNPTFLRLVKTSAKIKADSISIDSRRVAVSRNTKVVRKVV